MFWYWYAIIIRINEYFWCNIPNNSNVMQIKKQGFFNYTFNTPLIFHGLYPKIILISFLLTWLQFRTSHPDVSVYFDGSLNDCLIGRIDERRAFTILSDFEISCSVVKNSHQSLILKHKSSLLSHWLLIENHKIPLELSLKVRSTNSTSLCLFVPRSPHSPHPPILNCSLSANIAVGRAMGV